MRAVLALLVAVLAGCGGKDDDAGTPRTQARRPADDTQREQARFDAERRPDLVIAALAIGPGSRVADVGAGTGLLTLHLARAVAPTGTVVATDIDGAVLELLKARLDAAGLGDVVERKVVGSETPELEAGAYDAILLAEVDHYFADATGWLKAATAALKPNGRIVISNRIHHHAKSMANAQKAGLVLVSESTPVPTHFMAVFGAPAAGGKGKSKERP